MISNKKRKTLNKWKNKRKLNKNEIDGIKTCEKSLYRCIHYTFLEFELSFAFRSLVLLFRSLGFLFDHYTSYLLRRSFVVRILSMDKWVYMQEFF